MSNWREEANLRQEIRHTHDGPEVADRDRKKRRKGKPWRLRCSGRLFGDWTCGKYATSERAEQALRAKAKNKWLKNLRIEGPGYPAPVTLTEAGGET